MNVARADLLRVPPSKLVHMPAVANALDGAKTPGLSVQEAARLEALLKDVEDRSYLSPELLERAIEEQCWYHVTPFRGALVRALEIPASARVLEVGCGGGALTRYLGESGFQVVALETSEELAACARTRCEGLPNVEVITGFVESVIDDQQFDFVICVDPRFVESEFFDPGLQLLTLCKKALKATGSLILAVDNPLHAPKGAHVEPSKDHARGRGASLESIKQSLRSAGFLHFERYLAFPHHAAPQLLVDPERSRRDRVSWVSMAKELYAASEHAESELESWWRAILNEGLESSVAPGWLIIAHAHHVHSLLWNGEPVKQFALRKDTESVVEEESRKGIRVQLLGSLSSALVERVMNAAKPVMHSLRDFKDSLVAADRKIEELAFKEEVARERVRDAQDALARAEDQHVGELRKEQDSRRVREAELGLIIKQYHAVGAMCHDMREEGRKLKDMLEELRKRYVASEEWGAALAKRVSDAETELFETRASITYRVSQKVKRWLQRSPRSKISVDSRKTATI